MTASTVVNAIQKSGWIAIGAGNVNLNSDGTPGLAYRNLIKPGDTVTFEAGKNLTVVQPSTDLAKFTFALNSKLGSALPKWVVTAQPLHLIRRHWFRWR